MNKVGVIGHSLYIDNKKENFMDYFMPVNLANEMVKFLKRANY